MDLGILRFSDIHMFLACWSYEHKSSATLPCSSFPTKATWKRCLLLSSFILYHVCNKWAIFPPTHCFLKWVNMSCLQLSGRPCGLCNLWALAVPMGPCGSWWRNKPHFAQMECYHGAKLPHSIGIGNLQAKRVAHTSKQISKPDMNN